MSDAIPPPLRHRPLTIDPAEFIALSTIVQALVAAIGGTMEISARHRLLRHEGRINTVQFGRFDLPAAQLVLGAGNFARVDGSEKRRFVRSGGCCGRGFYFEARLWRRISRGMSCFISAVQHRA